MIPFRDENTEAQYSKVTGSRPVEMTCLMVKQGNGLKERSACCKSGAWVQSLTVHGVLSNELRITSKHCLWGEGEGKNVRED